MTLAWMGYGLLVGTLLAATAAALACALRLAGRPTRWVWGSALGLTAALTLAAPQRFRGDRDAAATLVVRETAAAPQRPRRDPSGVEAIALSLRVARDRALAASGSALSVLERSAPRWIGTGAALAWVAGSVALLALFLAVQARFARARRHWPLLDMHDTRVRLAPDVGPAVMGLARPEIVVPRWMLARGVEEQRMVLAHEGEHVAARDPLLLALGCLVVALLPWHPAAWWMLSRLRLAVELDCDARVLRRGAQPRSYGTLLIDLAGRYSALRIGAPALADESSHLERRLLAMNTPRPRHATARAALFAGAAGLALLAACEAELPTATDVADMSAATAAQGARKVRLLGPGDSGVVYFVDGVETDARTAEAIAPEKIASIEVAKLKDAAGGRGTIRIRTRAVGDTATRHDMLFVREGTDAAGAAKGEMKFRRFGGIVIVDGTVVDEAAMNRIPPADIVSVEVIKGPEATKLYPSADAAQGVIRITTKKGAAKR